MKDITLKIVGKLLYEGKEEDELEFVTDGKLYLRNGAMYIIYEESEFSGMQGCKTTLKLKDNVVKMRRNGEGGLGSELYFETGKRFSNVFNTSMGEIEVEVLTSKVENKIDQNNFVGDVDIEYAISLNGLTTGKNILKISVN